MHTMRGLCHCVTELLLLLLLSLLLSLPHMGSHTTSSEDRRIHHFWRSVRLRTHARTHTHIHTHTHNFRSPAPTPTPHYDKAQIDVSNKPGLLLLFLCVSVCVFTFFFFTTYWTLVLSFLFTVLLYRVMINVGGNGNLQSTPLTNRSSLPPPPQPPPATRPIY